MCPQFDSQPADLVAGRFGRPRRTTAPGRI